jgi:hypothetical protein
MSTVKIPMLLGSVKNNLHYRQNQQAGQSINQARVQNRAIDTRVSSVKCLKSNYGLTRVSRFKNLNQIRSTSTPEENMNNQEHNDIILWSETSFFIAYIDFVTVLVMVEFSNDTSSSFVEIEGSLVKIQIFAACPCLRIRLPDNQIYYVDFD